MREKSKPWGKQLGKKWEQGYSFKEARLHLGTGRDPGEPWGKFVEGKAPSTAASSQKTISGGWYWVFGSKRKREGGIGGKF